jgi:hypothetical protein
MSTHHTPHVPPSSQFDQRWLLLPFVVVVAVTLVVSVLGAATGASDPSPDVVAPSSPSPEFVTGDTTVPSASSALDRSAGEEAHHVATF